MIKIIKKKTIVMKTLALFFNKCIINIISFNKKNYMTKLLQFISQQKCTNKVCWAFLFRGRSNPGQTKSLAFFVCKKGINI